MCQACELRRAMLGSAVEAVMRSFMEQATLVSSGLVAIGELYTMVPQPIELPGGKGLVSADAAVTAMRGAIAQLDDMEMVPADREALQALSREWITSITLVARGFGEAITRALVDELDGHIDKMTAHMKWLATAWNIPRPAQAGDQA